MRSLVLALWPLAGRSAGDRRYIVLGIDGWIHYTQRVVWLLMTGQYPRWMRAKDGDLTNLRWSNLAAGGREATAADQAIDLLADFVGKEMAV